MSSAKWHFREKQPDETMRNPVQGEFFSEQAIDKPAQALVREVIQNSLDARVDGESVCVRFYLSGTNKALPPERAAFWFGDAWLYFKAPRNGLAEGDVPPEPQACPFLTVEDFGTTGLDGNPAVYEPDEDAWENRFFAFFRTEGLSSKRGGTGGRWGVGKTVFSRSSLINSFIGLTVRKSDRKSLLMGRSILFYHKLDASWYAPDGYCGMKEQQNRVGPIDDPAVIAAFEKDFVAQRGNAPGLSVVVPYVHSNIHTEDILRAVVGEYFLPILMGRLVVRIHSGETRKTAELNANTLSQNLNELGNKLEPGLPALVDLAIWARDQGDSARVTLKRVSSPPEWSNDLLPEDQAGDLAEQYRLGKPLSLRIPLKVRRVGKANADSYFDVYLQRDTEDRGSLPRYVRNGITIPNVRQRQVRGHRLLALTIIEDAPLAELLGDAEPPAHTHWSTDTRNFAQAGYRDGVEIIRYVSDAPRELAELLTRQDDKRDEYLLATFFPRPPEAEGVEVEEDDGDGGTGPKPPPPGKGPAKPQPFRVQRHEGGFRITCGDPTADLPSFCWVRMAYDTTHGNPLRKYKAFDFDVDNLDVQFKGAARYRQHSNLLVVRIDSDDFEMIVSGFDRNRDVYVNVKEMDTGDDSQN